MKHPVHAEDVKLWLAGAKAAKEDVQKNGEDPRDTRGDRWNAFLCLNQSIWETGEIPRQMR